MTSSESARAFELTPEQKYEFDLRGYIVLRRHYDEEAIDEFHAGIDELQAIPVEYETYRKLGIASFHLDPAMKDPQHPVWKAGYRQGRQPNSRTRVDHALCGTDKFDLIVRDPALRAIHTTLAGGAIYISATYYIEKLGPDAGGGGLHNGGYPVNRDVSYAYDHTNQRFVCKSTKSVVILSDMTRVEKGPFAAIPGSHKANLANPFDNEAHKNPMAVPVLAAPGDVIIFSEGMTHSAFPVTDDSIRRSVFFTYMPAIGSSNLTDQRMSIYPDHVLERLSDQSDLLTSAGYI